MNQRARFHGNRVVGHVPRRKEVRVARPDVLELVPENERASRRIERQRPRRQHDPRPYEADHGGPYFRRDENVDAVDRR